MTVRELIRLALLDLQVVAAGEAVPAAEAQDALVLLNSLLASWNLDSLWVYTIDRSVQTLTAGQASYTLGTGGDWAIARPHRLDTVAWRDTSTGLEIPLVAMTDQGYARLGLKASQSTIPHSYYYNLAFPLAVLTLYPVPSVANQLVLSVWHQVSAFASLDTVIALPPGYERALRCNLALELAPAWSATPHALLFGMALEAKGLLAGQNFRLEPVRVDAALTIGHYDIYTDTMR